MSQRVTQIENQSKATPSLNEALKPIKNLLQQLSINGQLSMNELKQRVSHSGLFFENKAQAKGASATPLNLERINQLIQQSVKSIKMTPTNSEPVKTPRQTEQKLNSQTSATAKKSMTTQLHNQLDNPAQAKKTQTTAEEVSQKPLQAAHAKTENPDLKLQLVKIIQSLQKLIESGNGLSSNGIRQEQTTLSKTANNPEMNQANASLLKENQTKESISDPQLKAALKALPPETNVSARGNPQILSQQASLTQQVQNQIKEMLTQVKTMLSQIETHQLMSIKNEQTGIQQFMFDLPMLKNGQIDSFEMRFEQQDQKQQKAANKYWKVVVKFDLEPLGPMFAQVELKNDRISTHIFAQSADTAQLIDSHLHVLKDSLTSAGINTDSLAANQGHVPETLIQQQHQGVDLRI
ncbi:MAG: flagellar hook-length control protein FliK [Enterobacterales bacterium]|nr:flagellar hook-length control protein FliK [Enterobacterales bacterium]